MLTKPLHPFQAPGTDLFLARGNMLAAMGTGTGKTVLAIAAAEELLGCGDIGTVLVVCPPSLKFQWARKISEFTDIKSQAVSVQGKRITIPRPPYGIIIEGKPYQRNGVKYTAADDRRRQYRSITPDTDYVIVGYDSVLDDSRQIRAIKPGMVVLDEASAIKSFQAQRTKKIKKLLAVEYRLGLTATPIENNPEELFSIMEWIDPEFLGRWDLFEKSYIVRNRNGTVVRYKNTHILRAKLAEVMYRKTREDPDVAPYLPEPETDEWPVRMDGPLRRAYTEIARDLLAELRTMAVTDRFDPAAYYSGQASESTKAGRAMAMHQALEMLLDHPDLVIMSGERYEESQRQKAAGKTKKHWPGSKYSHQKWQSGALDDCLDSPKIALLARNITRILQDPASKVIVFTKFRPLLDIIQAALGVRCAQYHGEMAPKAKEAAVATFTTDPRCRVFLSSHAGAYGRDLYMANHLVNVDQAPSAGRADQIDGRHVRASSEFSHVWVHNMITDGTIEERNRERLEFKKRVGRAFLDGEGADRMGRVQNEVEPLTAFLERTTGE